MNKIFIFTKKGINKKEKNKGKIKVRDSFFFLS